MVLIPISVTAIPVTAIMLPVLFRLSVKIDWLPTVLLVANALIAMFPERNVPLCIFFFHFVQLYDEDSRVNVSEMAASP